MQCNAMQCNAAQRNATQRNAMPRNWFNVSGYEDVTVVPVVYCVRLHCRRSFIVFICSVAMDSSPDVSQCISIVGALRRFAAQVGCAIHKAHVVGADPIY
eukprot:9592379-Lingulodinium_polyedra.AAC.1